jgi:hypothetical protein
MVSILVALGLAGAGLSSAEAAVAQPGVVASVAHRVPGAAVASKVYYRYYGGGYYHRPYPYARPYPYYRPYPYARPYPYYARPYYGGCRWVSRRVWTDYGYRVVRRRVCY